MRKNMKSLRVAMVFAFFVFLALPMIAAAGEKQQRSEDRWGADVGIGGTISTSEYKGVHSLGSALPILGYEGDHLYLRGLSGGLHIFKNGVHEFNVQLSYLPQQFYASWSDNSRIKALDDRYSSLTAGFNYRLTTPYGVGSASIGTDILGNSNGIIGDVSYAYPLRWNMVSIIPMIGMQWTDKNYNEYYYGISASESRASGLSKYSPEDAFSPYTGVTARILFSENWSFLINGKALFLNQEAYDSPMVGDDIKFSISSGVLYAF